MTDTSGFDSGRAVRGAVALLKGAPLEFLMWSIVFAGLPDAAITYVGAHFFQPELPLSFLIRWLVLVASVVASMFGLVVLQAIIAHRADDDHAAPRPHPRGSPFGLPGGLALVALGLVTSLGIVAGFILLVIPGIILSLAWLVAATVMVTERLGVMDSIRRSNALTGNARGPIFGLWIALGLIGWAANWLLGLVTDAVGIPAVTLIAGPALQVLVGLANSVLCVAIYRELRWSNEGPPTERLAEVFA